MSLWHQLHINMKSVVSWNYLLKDIRTVSGWNLDTVRFIRFFVFSLLNFCYIILTVHLPPHQVRCQSPAERQQALGNLDSHLADFLADSKESTLFTPGERRELEEDVQQAQQHCQDLLLNMETGEMREMDTPLRIMTQNTVYTNFHKVIVFFFSASVAEKDESVSRAYLSELQGITLRLKEAEQRLMRAIETPPPSRLSGDSANITVRITEQEVGLSTTWWLQHALLPCFMRSMLTLCFCPLSPSRKALQENDNE